jgi:hypothetical protein
MALNPNAVEFHPFECKIGSEQETCQESQLIPVFFPLVRRMYFHPTNLESFEKKTLEHRFPRVNFTEDECIVTEFDFEPPESDDDSVRCLDPNDHVFNFAELYDILREYY